MGAFALAVEVAAGALGVAVADLAAVITGFVVYDATASGDVAFLFAPGDWTAVVVAFLVNLALAPIGAALGVFLAHPHAPDRGYGAALLGAWAGQLPWVALAAMLTSALGTPGPRAVLLWPVLLLLHYVAVPLGAALALHPPALPEGDGEAPPPPGPYPLRLPTRPHEFHAAASPMLGSSLLRLAF